MLSRMIFQSQADELTEQYHDYQQLKKPKPCMDFSESDDDMISDLPDNVLCHILSFLPTKYAVGTSVLASRWKDLFTLIPNLALEFDDSLLLHPKPLGEEDAAAEMGPKEVRGNSFIDFVGGVLKRLLQDKANIYEFKLICEKIYDDDCIASWVRDAVMLRVQTVCLNAPMKDSGKVINALHGCTSLVELYLVNCSIRNVSHIEFPSLKKLVLDHVNLSDGESSALLIDGCWEIETLVLSHCEINTDCFCICVPWLKNLVIMWCFINNSTKMIVDPDELESFYYVGMLTETFEFTDSFNHIGDISISIIPMNKLLKVSDEELEASFYDYVKLAELINPSSDVESLTLGQFSIEALYHQSLPLPKFCKLKSLLLDTLGMAGWSTLGGLLENASNLETLHIEGFKMHEGGFESFLSSLPGVPSCLSSSLKIIKIATFRGQKDEIELIKYFLKNGKVMQKVFINCPFEGERDFAIFKRKFASALRSKTCETVWSWERITL